MRIEELDFSGIKFSARDLDGIEIQFQGFGNPISILREPKNGILGSPGRREEVCGFRRNPKIVEVGPDGQLHDCHRCSRDPSQKPKVRRMQILSAGPRDLGCRAREMA